VHRRPGRDHGLTDAAAQRHLAVQGHRLARDDQRGADRGGRSRRARGRAGLVTAAGDHEADDGGRGRRRRRGTGGGMGAHPAPGGEDHRDRRDGGQAAAPVQQRLGQGSAGAAVEQVLAGVQGGLTPTVAEREGLEHGPAPR
jgi:hypothetical protein